MILWIVFRYMRRCHADSPPTLNPRWTHGEPTLNPRWTHVEPTLNPRRDGSRPTVCDVKPNYSYFKLFFWKSGCPKFFCAKFQMNEPAWYGWIMDYRFLRSFWDFSFDLFKMIPESRVAHGHPTANFLSCVLRTEEWVFLKIWLPWVFPRQISDEWAGVIWLNCGL